MEILKNQRYFDCLEYARAKHCGQTRRGGKEYITHPIEVSEMLLERGYSAEYALAGLFHDLLEDTDATHAEIKALASEGVLRAVILLTKSDGYVMSEYLGEICNNPMSKAVKAMDRLHNLRSALEADENFRIRYIKESIEWYLTFDSEIPMAVRALIDSLSEDDVKAELARLLDRRLSELKI